MSVLIIPCAGRSSRFHGMKPKWMLTHPDGRIMVEKAMEGLDLSVFSRIIITIVKPHDELYGARLFLEQVFEKNPKVKICMLDDFTTSASETVALTLRKMKVQGAFIIRDSDNYVKISIARKVENFVVGCSLTEHRNVPDIPGKSFIRCNSHGILQTIVEKQIISDTICLGIYAFAESDAFLSAYDELRAMHSKGEMYISHIVYHMLLSGTVFTVKMAEAYEDWGTSEQWRAIQKRYATYFIDVDGVIMENSGKYGALNWDNNTTFIMENVGLLIRLQEAGAQIVITTSRPEEYRARLEKLLASVNIRPVAILMGMHHAPRVIINDFAPTNPYPSASAVSMPRNASLEEYLYEEV